MIRVTISDLEVFATAIQGLSAQLLGSQFALDVETTGLDEHDRIFGLIIYSPKRSFYFNFNELEDKYLLKESFKLFKPLFEDKSKSWFIHNAIFDLAMLKKENLFIKGKVYCTMTLERVIRNNRMQYGLDALAKVYEKIIPGMTLKLGDEVKEYITKNRCFTKHKIEGKDTLVKKMHYDFVPLDLMARYGHRDAEICFKLGVFQRDLIRTQSLTKIGSSECMLTPVVLEMYTRGITMDIALCQEGFDNAVEEVNTLRTQFFSEFGSHYSKSRLEISAIFSKFKLKVPLTDKGNPCFNEDALKSIEHPLPKLILEIRKKEKFIGTYYSTYLTSHSWGIIKPFPSQSGTETGRFSYRSPNLQNVPRNSHLRKIFSPREHHFFVMIDFDQQEYRLLADLACERSLIKQVCEGKDVHTATAELMRVDRFTAKTINFALLYGAGAATLAKTLGTTEEEALRLKQKYFSVLPNIQRFIKRTINESKHKGHIHNFAGRRLHVKKGREFVAVNHLIQSSGADVVKLAMLGLHSYLSDKRSAMVLQVHDEIIFEIHKDELLIINDLKSIMEGIYKPINGLNLTCSVGYSFSSWGDKIEGVPDAEEARNYFQGKGSRRTSSDKKQLLDKNSAAIN